MQIGAELYMQGANAPVRVLLRNISVGGCSSLWPTLTSENGELKIVVWVERGQTNNSGRHR